MPCLAPSESKDAVDSVWFFYTYNAIETVRKRGRRPRPNEKGKKKGRAGRRPGHKKRRVGGDGKRNKKKYTEAPKVRGRGAEGTGIVATRSRGQEVDPRHGVNVIGLGDVRGVDARHEKDVDGQGIKEAL